MKMIHLLKTCKIVFLLVAIGTFSFYACSSSSDNTIIDPDGLDPDPENPDDVTTLIANFQGDDGISIDENGTIYVSSFGNFTGTQVFNVDPETGEFGVTVTNLQAPTGNIINNSGTIFIVHNVRLTEAGSSDTIGDVISVDTDGNRTVLATLPGFPSGIALDAEGNVYVSNFDFPGVHRITPDGEVSLFVEDSRLLGGVGIDFDDNGNLFVGNFISGDIIQINTDLSIEVLATLPTVRQNVVIGYITYLDGFIYATAVGQHVIYRISMTGDMSIFAGSGAVGSQSGTLLESTFNTPNGISGDANRDVLYVTDSGGLRVINLN